MVPIIKSGAECLIVPLEDGDPKKGDVVFCRVKGRVLLHLVKAVKGDRYQIGNNKGGINGWVGRQAIFGKLADVG